MLSVILCTIRKDPRFREMADSLAAAQRYAARPLELIVVDGQLWYQADRRAQLADAVRGRFRVRHVEPKPNVWQGPHRLTSKDHWAKGNALNTGLVFVSLPRVAVIDDCTIVDEAWVHQHLTHDGALAGTYRYLAPGATVVGGRLVEGIVASEDHRVRGLPDGGPCVGGWLFGGNMSFPLEDGLDVNGWDESFGGAAGSSDCDFGVRMERALARRGVRPVFDPGCVIHQLTETHEAIASYSGVEAATARGELPTEACGKGFLYRDASGERYRLSWNHALIWRLTGHRAERDGEGHVVPVYAPELEPERQRYTTTGNPFSLRELRARVRGGEPFPIPAEPTHDWRDGQPLAEM